VVQGRVEQAHAQQAVGQHHVIHHVALADLFAAELLRSGQVLAVVVAEVVVGHNAADLDRGLGFRWL
jgi:hypothetical protein